MTNLYYMPRRARFGHEVMVPFPVFGRPIESLYFRNDRLKVNRLSIHADLVQQRCQGTEIDFRHLVQADFILFMRSVVDTGGELSGCWFPQTLALSQGSGPFELFARSRSKDYFDRVKILLGISAKEDLEPIFKAFSLRSQYFPRWGGFHSFKPEYLLGFEHLASRA